MHHHHVLMCLQPPHLHHHLHACDQGAEQGGEHVRLRSMLQGDRGGGGEGVRWRWRFFSRGRQHRCPRGARVAHSGAAHQ